MGTANTAIGGASMVAQYKNIYLTVLLMVCFGFFTAAIAADEEDYEDVDVEESQTNTNVQNFEPAEPSIETTPTETTTPPTTTAETLQGPSDTTPVEISPGTKKILGVEFKQNQAFSQVLIKLNEPAAYKSFTEDNGQLVVLHIKNATLPPKFRRFLDTSEFRSAVTFIKPYVANGQEKGVKIAIQLRDKAAVDVKRDGNNIIADIEIPQKYFKSHPKEASIQEEKEQLGEAPTDGEEATSETTTTENVAGGDKELETQLKEEGEIKDGKLSNEEVGATKDDEPQTPKTDIANDEYLGIQASDIEGFTIKELEDDNKRYTGKTITIQFKDADVMHVMDFISEISGMNVILGDDVRGKVNIKLKDVPWDQALSLILRSKGLGAVRHGNVIRVTGLDVLRKEQADAAATIDAAKKLEPLITVFIPLSYSDAADIATKLKDFTTEGRGKITIDARTNTLIVQDISRNIERLKNIVTKLDTQTPQVLIEARIVEVSENFSNGFNINWTAFGGKIISNPLMSLSNITLGDSNFKGTKLGGFNVGVLNLAKIGDIAMALQIGESRNEVKLLSSPRIVTQDGKAATITQTEQINIPNKTTTIANNGVVSTTTETKTLDAQLNLTVTPHIRSDGGVIMDLNIQNQFFKDVEGARGSRAAQTSVLVENGDTTVIGGIYSTQTNKSRSGIPGLSWIPIVGWLFTSYQSVSMKNELLIFLTPTITNFEKAFVSDAKESKAEPLEESSEESPEETSDETTPETSAPTGDESDDLSDKQTTEEPKQETLDEATNEDADAIEDETTTDETAEDTEATEETSSETESKDSENADGAEETSAASGDWGDSDVDNSEDTSEGTEEE